MGTALPRRAAQRFADHLNGVLNRTVSDSRLVVAPIPGEPDTFKLTRVVEEDDVPLELDGTTARLFVQQVVVVEDDQCRTESYLEISPTFLYNRPVSLLVAPSGGRRCETWDFTSPVVRPPLLMTACCRGDQLRPKPPTALVAAQSRLPLATSAASTTPTNGASAM